LYKQLSQDEGDKIDSKNKGHIQEMKIKMKYNKDVNQIVEEDEYGDEFESEDQDEGDQV
jgi:hypothetical protein